MGFGVVYPGNTHPWHDSFEIPRADRSLATNVKTGEEVAIKLEHVSIDFPPLNYEANVYQLLSGGVGIPRVHALLFECEY